MYEVTYCLSPSIVFVVSSKSIFELIQFDKSIMDEPIIIKSEFIESLSNPKETPIWVKIDNLLKNSDTNIVMNKNSIITPLSETVDDVMFSRFMGAGTSIVSYKSDTKNDYFYNRYNHIADMIDELSCLKTNSVLAIVFSKNCMNVVDKIINNLSNQFFTYLKNKIELLKRICITSIERKKFFKYTFRTTNLLGGDCNVKHKSCLPSYI